MSTHEWIITAHSVERYQQRCAPKATELQARAALRNAILSASPLRQRTYNGQSLWKTEDGVFLVTKYDRKMTVVVTVLSETECAELASGKSSIPADELELIQEYSRDLPLVGLPSSGKPLSELESEPAGWKAQKRHLEETLQQRNQKIAALRMQADALAQENRILRKRLDLKKRAQELASVDPAVKALEAE